MHVVQGLPTLPLNLLVIAENDLWHVPMFCAASSVILKTTDITGDITSTLSDEQPQPFS